jgi:hypothetical protein
MNPDPPEIDQVDRQRLRRAQIWLYRAGCVILIAGLTGSAWAYHRTANAANDAAANAIPSLKDSKVDQYRLEIYGGKANVLSTEIAQWFDGLWHGRQLAYTLAVLTTVIVLMIFLIAEFLPHFPPFPPANYDRNEDSLGNKRTPK